MDNIKDIVHQVIGKIAERTPQPQEKIDRIWQNILEKQELKHTQLSGIKDGQLFVNVDSPAWLFQMNIRKAKIIERLKTEMPDIKSIRFKIGPPVNVAKARRVGKVK